MPQECETDGNLRQAEQYYIESGDWKAAVNMYRSQDMWDEAHRVGGSFILVLQSERLTDFNMCFLSNTEH